MGPLSRSVRFACLLALVLAGTSAVQAQTVSGTVFRDYNATGVQDSGEPGVEGISIDVFDATGANVGSTTTATDGTFSAALSVGAGTDVRVELGGIPSYLAPGPFGSDSATTLFFAQSGDTGLSVGLANPGQHCPDTTDISTVCFLTGPQTTTDGVIVSLPETGGSNSAVDATLFDLPAYTEEAASNEVGAVWGLAYRSRTDVLYAGAFVKRLSDLGPTANPTTIYEIDRGGATVSTWLTLDGARTNPHSGGIDGWARDFDAFDDVFKEGLGDVDISEDENTLYTVDLATRDLVTIAINADGSAGTVTRVPIVAAVFPTLSGDGCASTDDVRPYGLGVNDGTVYLGVVCSAQSSVDEGMDLPIEGPVFTGSPAYPGDTSELTGYVFAWDGAVSFSEVLSFPLDYSRGCTFQNNLASCATSHPGLWRPWVDTYPFYDAPGLDRHSAGYPQPVISDIEFDDGDMILGLNDRWGHQTGPRSITPAYPLNEPPNTEGELRSPFNAGDLLRACANGATWLIEELVDPLNTGCGTAGTSSNAGGTIVTDEYYFAEGHALATPQHGELGLGGMTQIPGRSDVISSIYDPVLTFTNELDDGGLGWFDNASGGWTKSYRLYDGSLSSPGSLLLKAAGVGDVAPFCARPPIEIGNRVWDDTIPNGRQDPGEAGLNGVTVRLVCGGAEIATTMTSNFGGLGDDGSYLFNDANVTGGVPFDTACEVRVDPADAALGGRVPTTANAAGTNDVNDSDGLPVGGFLVVGFTTGGPGANNHTYDFGFTSVMPASITVTKDASPITLPEPGGMVTYTITVTNNSATVGVTIDTLTDDVSGNLDGQGTCSVPQVIAPSGSYMCQYTVMVTGAPGDTVTCTTTASGTDDFMNPVSDDDPADVTITDVPSSIEVVKTADPTSIAEPGGPITFTVMVTNTSAVDTVTIDSLVDDVAGDLNGQGTCSVPQVLAPSASYTCSYTGNVSGMPGDVVTCTVTASGTDDDGDPVSDDDPADVTITDEPSSIEVTKTADPTTVPEPGGTVTFTVMVTNTSAVDTVTIDSLVDDVAGDLNGQGTCSVPQVLAPGESYTCSYQGDVMGDPGDVVTCTVTASGTDDDGDPVSDDDPADVLIVGVAQLVATKAVVDGDLVPGGTVVYEVVVTNVGAGTQNDNPGPEFEDILPEELILDDAQATSGSVTLDLPAKTVRWDGSLASGESVVITIFASISVDAVGEIANQGCVFSDTDDDGTNDLKGVTDDPDVGGQDDPTVIDIPPTIGIPTLSEVALLLLTAILIVAGLGTLRRRSGHGPI